jgi:hypothetical protein
MRRLVLLAIVIVSSAVVAPVAAASGSPRPLGTFRVTSVGDDSCPAGYACRSFRVACPGIEQSVDGFLGIGPPTGEVRGTVVVFSGARGTTWWSARGPAWAQSLTDLRADGFQVVQVRWRNGWFASSSGDEAGAKALACRPATVLRWIHDHVYVPLGLPHPALGRCGFCALGWSSGSSAAVYPLTHYGLGSILDAIVAVSGPVHGDIAKGCAHLAGDEAFWYTTTARDQDASYGFGRNGPCELHDRTWRDRWLRDGIATSAIETELDHTRVTAIIGNLDRGPAPAQSEAVTDLLISGGSPMVAVTKVPGMRHAPNAAGLAEMRAALDA